MGLLEDRQARVGSILQRLPRSIRRPQVAEVGVLVGAMSEMLLSSRPKLHLTMVDSWAGAEDLPDAYRDSGDVHAHQTIAEALANKAEAAARVARFRNRTTILHMPSVEAAKAHLNVFDLVFLDADHSYEAVAADLRAWAPAVKPGGWLGGHDYGHSDPRFHFGVKQAVDEWAEQNGLTVELGGDFTWFCRLP